MSSTFALPTPFRASVRRPRLRRVQTPHLAAEQTPVVVAAEPADADGQAAGMSFLPTPDTWQLTATRPVSYLDHVAVAPVGVLAITTRFHLATANGEHVARAWQDIRTAKGAAKLLELTMGDCVAAVEVRPVLVIWGPGAPELPNGYLLVKGVYVLDPARPELWSHLFDAPALDEIRRAAMVDTLRTLQVSSNDTPIEVDS